MMGSVISLQQYREENAQHMTGEAHCICCGHEWSAVAPVGADFLECPECGTYKGAFTRPVLRGEHEWSCACGNTLFKISPDGVYCPSCGDYQRGF